MRLDRIAGQSLLLVNEMNIISKPWRFKRMYGFDPDTTRSYKRLDC